MCMMTKIKVQNWWWFHNQFLKDQVKNKIQEKLNKVFIYKKIYICVRKDHLLTSQP